MPDDLQSELLTIYHRAGAELSEVAHKQIFWTEASFNELLPLIIRQVAASDLTSLEGVDQIDTPVFGFLSAAFSLVSGTQQILDKTTHRPRVTQLKGFVDVLNGLQTITTQSLMLTGAALGPPAFAATVGVHFALSLDQAVHSFRRLDTDYWLKDTTARMQKNEEIITEISEFIRKKKDEHPLIAPNSLLAGLIKQKEQQLAKLEKKQQLLIKDTTIQILMREDKKPDNGAFRADLFATWLTKDKPPAKWLQACNEALKQPPSKDEIKQQHAAITKKNGEQVYHAVSKSIILGMLFAGSILLCVPGLQIPGLAVMAAAVSIFLIKNAPTAVRALKNKLAKVSTENHEIHQVHHDPLHTKQLKQSLHDYEKQASSSSIDNKSREDEEKEKDGESPIH